MEKKDFYKQLEYEYGDITYRQLVGLFIIKFILSLQGLTKSKLANFLIILILLIQFSQLYFNLNPRVVAIPGNYVDATVFSKLPNTDGKINALGVKHFEVNDLEDQMYLWIKYKGANRYIDRVEPTINPESEQRFSLETGIYDMQMSAFLAVHDFIGKPKKFHREVYVTDVSIASGGKPKILPSDIILSVDGKIVTDTFDILKYQKEPIYRDVKVLRGEEEHILRTDMLGVNVSRNLYLSDFDDYEEFYSFADIALEGYSGRSAGAALALAYYSSEFEDVVKGRNIAVTGTIDEYGKIGEIGGIRQKTLLAVRNHADILFVPGDSELATNYTDALEVAKGLNSDISIVIVEKFSDLINYLKIN